MNQKYNLENGSSKYKNQTIFQNINKISNQWAFGKVKHSQSYLFKDEIKNKILNGLSRGVLVNIFASLELVYLDQNEYIYKPDDFISYLYFPESAVISEYQILEDGKTIEIMMTGSEGMTGISSIFNSQQSPNWTQVTVGGKALRINSEVLLEEFKHCPEIQVLLFDYVNSYINQISQKVICNGYHSVEEKLCCWLLMLQDRCLRNKLTLTQEQIARSLGVHRPSITITTQSLREKEIIDYRRGKISILDRQKLESSACICYWTTKDFLKTV